MIGSGCSKSKLMVKVSFEKSFTNTGRIFVIGLAKLGANFFQMGKTEQSSDARFK